MLEKRYREVHAIIRSAASCDRQFFYQERNQLREQLEQLGGSPWLGKPSVKQANEQLSKRQRKSKMLHASSAPSATGPRSQPSRIFGADLTNVGKVPSDDLSSVLSSVPNASPSADPSIGLNASPSSEPSSEPTGAVKRTYQPGRDDVQPPAPPAANCSDLGVLTNRSNAPIKNNDPPTFQLSPLSSTKLMPFPDANDSNCSHSKFIPPRQAKGERHAYKPFKMVTTPDGHGHAAFMRGFGRSPEDAVVIKCPTLGLQDLEYQYLDENLALIQEGKNEFTTRCDLSNEGGYIHSNLHGAALRRREKLESLNPITIGFASAIESSDKTSEKKLRSNNYVNPHAEADIHVDNRAGLVGRYRVNIKVDNESPFTLHSGTGEHDRKHPTDTVSGHRKNITIAVVSHEIMTDSDKSYHAALAPAGGRQAIGTGFIYNSCKGVTIAEVAEEALHAVAHYAYEASRYRSMMNLPRDDAYVSTLTTNLRQVHLKMARNDPHKPVHQDENTEALLKKTTRTAATLPDEEEDEVWEDDLEDDKDEDEGAKKSASGAQLRRQRHNKKILGEALAIAKKAKEPGSFKIEECNSNNAKKKTYNNWLVVCTGPDGEYISDESVRGLFALLRNTYDTFGRIEFADELKGENLRGVDKLEISQLKRTLRYIKRYIRPVVRLIKTNGDIVDFISTRNGDGSQMKLIALLYVHLKRRPALVGEVVGYGLDINRTKEKSVEQWIGDRKQMGETADDDLIVQLATKHRRTKNNRPNRVMDERELSLRSNYYVRQSPTSATTASPSNKKLAVWCSRMWNARRALFLEYNGNTDVNYGDIDAVAVARRMSKPGAKDDAVRVSRQYLERFLNHNIEKRLAQIGFYWPTEYWTDNDLTDEKIEAIREKD